MYKRFKKQFSEIKSEVLGLNESQNNVFDSIQIRAINGGIPLCIIEEAKNLYKKVSEIRIHRGSNRNGIIEKKF